MNVIEDMRQRLTESFSGINKPLKGMNVSSVFRPTANNMPRSPRSSIPDPKPKFDTPGRPATAKKSEPLFREKPKDIFGGWL